jgi:phage shock protein PspC (stress-responsive transcriptional regulator)
LEIQEKLARVRRAYIVGGIVGGLTWWFLWIPVLMVLLALVHVNLYAHAPLVIWSGIAVGVVGLAGMLWLYGRSRKPSHDRLRRFVDEAMVARSLQRAQAQLDEVRRFANEAA